MSSGVILVAAAITGYAVGAISPAAALARLAGVDLRRVGSGNPGATNVRRALGLRAGILVAVVDIAKGAVPAAAFGTVGRNVGMLAGFCAVIGHITSPFLGGHGGKGAATTAGAVIGSFPAWAPGMFLVWFLVLALTRWVALASVCAVASVLATALVTGATPITLLWAAGLTAVVVERHRTNFRDFRGHLRGIRRPGSRSRRPTPPIRRTVEGGRS